MRITPKLRFSEFIDEWELINIGTLLEFKNGINATKEQYGKGIKYISVMDILSNQYITYENIRGLVNIDEKTFKNNEVSYGDILFQRSSETREDIGQANTYLDQNRNATFGGFVIRGKKNGEYNPIFFNYLLKTSRARKEIILRGAGAQHYNIGQESLAQVELHFPTIKEQEKIALTIQIIDSYISNKEQTLSALEQQKKGLMQKLFSQEARFKDDNGREYPKWKEIKLGEITKITNGNGDVQDAQLEYMEGLYPFFDRSETIKYLNKFLYNEEAIIYPGEGKNFLPRYYNGKYALHQRCYTIHEFKFDLIYPKYLYWYLSTQSSYFQRYAVGSTVPSLRIDTFVKAKIKIPSIYEQKKIANYLSKMDELIENEKQTLKAWEKFKKGLLQQMFI